MILELGDCARFLDADERAEAEGSCVPSLISRWHSKSSLQDCVSNGRSSLGTRHVNWCKDTKVNGFYDSKMNINVPEILYMLVISKLPQKSTSCHKPQLRPCASQTH